jgi:ribonuclease HI
MYFDGSCVPTNPGKVTVGGCLIKNESGEVIFKKSVKTTHSMPQSNNYAEYKGLSIGLDWIKKNKEQIEEVEVFGDSDMVIKQMMGRYKIKAGKMYSEIATEVMMEFIREGLNLKTRFIWIPREMNTEADALTR